MVTAMPLVRARIEDLYSTPGKAELVDGELRLMAPTGAMPGRASKAILLSLEEYALDAGGGEAVGDNIGFLVDLPHRQSFSPDAAFWTGPDPGMKFYQGAPVFAVEVRSEHDYGSAAEREMTAKRTDYFAAGARVVWDVDLQARHVVRVYAGETPQSPRTYKLGELAEAEPAVPGWTLLVDKLFGH